MKISNLTKIHNLLAMKVKLMLLKFNELQKN